MKDLVKEEFKQAIIKGTGKAILLLKKHPEIDFSKMIMKACLINQDYDPQCSGDRAEYLFEMIHLLKNRENFENKLLEEFLKPDLDYWGTDQMFELVRLMAKNGNHRAKETIYQKYDQLWESDGEVTGAWTIISLDGLEGLAYVAEKTGRYLKEHPDESETDRFIEHATEIEKGVDPREYLQKKARTNEFIRSYLDAVERGLQKQKTRRNNKSPTYDEIKSKIESSHKFHGYYTSRMKDEDIERLAHDFQQENDDGRLITYLEIFSFRKYPNDYRDVLKHVYSKSEDVRSGAIRSLQYFKNEDVRKLMTDHFKTRKHLSEAFRLLKENYHHSDIKDMEFLMSTENDMDEFHYMAMELEDVVDAFDDQALAGVLLIAYERGCCAMCRERFVRGLIQLKSLPDWIVEEGVYDCNKEVRNTIENYKK